MRTLSELLQRLRDYHDVHYAYVEGQGGIAWHVSTGDNLEMLFLDAPGYGAQLYAAMAKQVLAHGPLPYHSVFCYCLASNRLARKFYHKMGFTEVDLGQSIYRSDGCILLWITWEDLLDVLRKYHLID